MTSGRRQRLLRGAAILAVALSIASCNRDHSITRGADGRSDWDRRLRAAIPIGSPIASAQSTMEHNGFRCRRDALGAQMLRCEKYSPRKFGFFRRHWQATVQAPHGQVSAIQSSTRFGGHP